jgi:hypothetical protein
MGTHQLLICVEDVDLLGDNTDINRYREEKAQEKLYVAVWAQGCRKNHIKTANRAVKSLAQFKQFEMTVTIQNLIQENIKRKLDLGNDCYHSVQYL